MCAMPYAPCPRPDLCPWRSTPALPSAEPCGQNPSVAGAAIEPTQYSLIVPVYNNQESIGRLIETLQGLSERLDGMLEVVFVVDGSPDRSYEMLRERLQSCLFPAQLICLSRNFGSFAAIRMGLSAARGPYFAVMAADLQEPVELIHEFFKSLSGEPVDIAVGTRTERDDPLLSKVSANLFWWIYWRLVQRDMPPGGIDAFACNRQVRDALMALDESNTSLVGQVVWLGFRRKSIPYRRLARTEGRSGWTFRRKLRYMLDSIFSFTDLPLTILMAVGTVGSLFSVAAGIVVFAAWYVGGIATPGYTPIILAILLAMFCELLGLGVIGAYVWRAYENTKHRPAFLPMLHESFPKSQAAPKETMS